MNEFGALSYLTSPFIDHFPFFLICSFILDMTTNGGGRLQITHTAEDVFPTSLYPNAICLETNAHTILTLTTQSHHHCIIGTGTEPRLTCATVSICAVLWHCTGQASVSWAHCMSSWAGCHPGDPPLLPTRGSCHLLLVPACQTESSTHFTTTWDPPLTTISRLPTVTTRRHQDLVKSFLCKQRLTVLPVHKKQVDRTTALSHILIIT